MRWIAANGSIVNTESEWYAQWNPWAKKLEKIVGRHTISEQPIGDANVFAEPKNQCIVKPMNENAIEIIALEIENISNSYSNDSNNNLKVFSSEFDFERSKDF